MTQDWSEKTQAPTPYRRAEARRDGKVARSAELSAAIMCLAALVLLKQGGPVLVTQLKLLLSDGLSSTSITPLARTKLIGEALAPFAGGLLLIALAANLAQTGMLLGLRRDSGVLNPFAGLGRIFSGRSFVGLLMNLGKLAIIAAVAWVTLGGHVDSLVTLQRRPADELLGAGGGLLYAVVIRVAIVLIVFAIVDYAYQRHAHERSLRMSWREVKEELRRQEGDPSLRRRRRSIAQEWMNLRVQRDVAGADVVLVDEKFEVAVALRYRAGETSAPRVLAKCRGAAATQRVRDAAARRGVAIIERSALAAAIAQGVLVGRDVPARFHADLADVFAYVRTIHTGEARTA